MWKEKSVFQTEIERVLSFNVYSKLYNCVPNYDTTCGSAIFLDRELVHLKLQFGAQLYSTAELCKLQLESTAM